MAGEADFTEEEWKTMQKGLTGAGLLVSVSDRDFTDSFGEASALAKHLAAEHAHNGSELVRELAHVHGTGFGMTTSPKEVEAETLAALSAATATLAAKAPDDVGAYRQAVLDLADAVANAKGGLAPAEVDAIEKIKEALSSA